MAALTGPVPNLAPDQRKGMHVAQISPCVGGVLRTWTSGGVEGIWSTPDEAWLRWFQATRWISRTSSAVDRFREAGMLDADKGVLLLPLHYPTSHEDPTVAVDAQVIRLDPIQPSTRDIFREFDAVLLRGIAHSFAAGEQLIIEVGGRGDPTASQRMVAYGGDDEPVDDPWDGPDHYCVIDWVDDGSGPQISLTTTPWPTREWMQYWPSARTSTDDPVTQSLPDSLENRAAVVRPICEAVFGWGTLPWDLVFTYRPICGDKTRGRPPATCGRAADPHEAADSQDRHDGDGAHTGG